MFERGVLLNKVGKEAESRPIGFYKQSKESGFISRTE